GPMEEANTTPISVKDQCANVTCRRTVDNRGKRHIDGCPPGCLCVLKGPDSKDNLDGTCYLLATTPKSTTTSTEQSFNMEE
uniref:Rhipicephalus microplus RaCI2 n=2 Tax=Rhipicephalus TaxID=34630 RepID=UPI000789C1C2|nr:Chain D, Rhipicephalus microplus RaCI2 [Rhipicephalus microplus]